MWSDTQGLFSSPLVTGQEWKRTRTFLLLVQLTVLTVAVLMVLTVRKLGTPPVLCPLDPSCLVIFIPRQSWESDTFPRYFLSCSSSILPVILLKDDDLGEQQQEWKHMSPVPRGLQSHSTVSPCKIWVGHIPTYVYLFRMNYSTRAPSTRITWYARIKEKVKKILELHLELLNDTLYRKESKFLKARKLQS